MLYNFQGVREGGGKGPRKAEWRKKGRVETRAGSTGRREKGEGNR
jgi:hypothetical protein